MPVVVRGVQLRQAIMDGMAGGQPILQNGLVAKVSQLIRRGRPYITRHIGGVALLAGAGIKPGREHIPDASDEKTSWRPGNNGRVMRLAPSYANDDIAFRCLSLQTPHFFIRGLASNVHKLRRHVPFQRSGHVGVQGFVDERVAEYERLLPKRRGLTAQSFKRMPTLDVPSGKIVVPIIRRAYKCLERLIDAGSPP